MSLAQALAIAAAAWVTVVAADPSMAATWRHTQSEAARMAANLRTTARASQRLDDGFCATPDGIRLERKATLR